jgi:hypothetical protein
MSKAVQDPANHPMSSSAPRVTMFEADFDPAYDLDQVRSEAQHSDANPDLEEKPNVQR